jgi:hypothetical protein
MRRALLGPIGAVVVGLLLSSALDDAAGLARLGPSSSRAALGIGVIAATGAVQGAGWPWLLARSRARPVRDASAGALVAGLAAAMAVHASLGWVDLGPFGAGPPGELSLLVAPLAQLLAVLATLGAREEPRAAGQRHTV